MTGGKAEIQDIQPFFGSTEGNLLLEVPQEHESKNSKRDAKTVSKLPRKTAVDVFIQYPANTVVDMNEITSKLVKNETGASFGRERDDGSAQVESLENRNAALFWILIVLCLLIVLLAIIIVFCCCCPGCYFYKADKTNSVGIGSGRVASDEREIQVLTVRDGAGKELKDARFVEIFKSARNRIKSATSAGERGRSSGFRRWILRSGEDSSLFESNDRTRATTRAFKVVDSRDNDSIILMSDGKPSFIRSDTPFHRLPKHHLEELDVRSLEKEVMTGSAKHRGDRSKKVPSEKGKVFKTIEPEERNSSRQGGEDIQIWRLDEETKRGETFQKIGGSEILSLDDVGKENQAVQTTSNQSPQLVDNQTNMTPPEPEHSTRNSLQVNVENHRSRSDMDLSKIPDPADGGEFYTAIGPDGKEIILRRYLNDQTPESDPFADRGFLNMALVHLQQEHNQRNPQKMMQDQYHQHFMGSHNTGVDGYETGDSIDENGSVGQNRHSFITRPGNIHPDIRSFRHSSNQTDIVFDPKRSYDLTPKHQIRTPILEENENAQVESTELQRLRPWKKDRYTISYDNSDASVLRFHLNNRRSTSPEPAYTETKASILRRRNTMAKLLMEEDKAYNEERINKQRHLSLNDLHRRVKNSETAREARMRRWKSLSNDELYDLGYQRGFWNQQQQSNIRANDPSMPRYLHPHYVTSDASPPRKFTKHHPNGTHTWNQNDRNQQYQHSPSFSASPYQVNMLDHGYHHPEPLWSRLTNTLRRAYDNQRGNRRKPNKTAGYYDPRQQIYVYPDQLSSGSDSSGEIYSPSASDVMFHQMSEREHPRRARKSQNDRKQGHHISATQDVMNTRGNHSNPSSIDFTFDANGDVVGKSQLSKKKRSSRLRDISPRYMEWYNSTKHGSPERQHGKLSQTYSEIDNKEEIGAPELRLKSSDIKKRVEETQQEQNESIQRSQDNGGLINQDHVSSFEDDVESGISSLSQHAHRTSSNSHENPDTIPEASDEENIRTKRAKSSGFRSEKIFNSENFGGQSLPRPSSAEILMD